MRQAPQQVGSRFQPISIAVGVAVGVLGTVLCLQLLESKADLQPRSNGASTVVAQEQADAPKPSSASSASLRVSEREDIPAVPSQSPVPSPSSVARVKNAATSSIGGTKGALTLTPELARSAATALDCQGVCEIEVPEERVQHTEGEYIPKLTKPLSCNRVMLRMLSTCPAVSWPPPKDPPAKLRDAYTMNGRAKLTKWYMSQRYSGGNAMVKSWSPAYIDNLVEGSKDERKITVYDARVDPYMRNVVRVGCNRFKQAWFYPSYSHKGLLHPFAPIQGVPHDLSSRSKYLLFSQYTADLEGKIGMVIGTEKPWVEAHLLAFGAKHVITLEYGRIDSTDPRLTPVVASEIAALYLQKGGVQVDFIVTYSSLEHSGLGRYGDSLNPFGDWEAMAQSWCMLKPGGLFLLGVPTKGKPYDKDEVAFNAHRWYGSGRIRHMAANFDFLQVYDGPVDFSGQFFAMRKPEDPENRLYVPNPDGSIPS